MVVVLHLLIALICTVECLRALSDVRGRFPRLVMFAGLGLIHGLVPAITPASWYMAEFSESSRMHAAALALVGVILFSIGWHVFEAPRARFTGLSTELETIIDSHEGQVFLRRLFWFSAVVGLVGWVASVLASGLSLSEVFLAGRFAYRRTGSTSELYLSAIAQYFITLALIPGFLGFFLPRRYRMIGIVYAVAMAVLLFMASRGSRANSIGLLGCLVMGYALRYRLSALRVVVVGGAGLALIFLTVALYDVRRTMAQQTPGEIVSMLMTAEPYQGALSRDPLSYHQFLVAAVEYFPDRHPYLNGATYRRLLVFFIPGYLFPDLKPPDTNMVFGEVINPYGAAGFNTIPPTMMGDGYINFWGWPGILIMLVNGLAFGYVSYKIRTSLLWFIALGAPFVRMAMLAIRGQPYEILLVAISSLVVIWIVGRMLGFSFRQAQLQGRMAVLAPA